MASRTRLATTRRARYGTVVRPTKVASRSAADARMTVPQTLPASRDTVENNAAAKARVSPTIASRNRTHTCDSPNHEKRDGAAGCETFCVLAKVTVSPVSAECLYQHMMTGGRGEVTEDIASGSIYETETKSLRDLSCPW